MSIGLASAEGGVGELTEVRRIAQFFRIMRIVRIFKVSGFSQYNYTIEWVVFLLFGEFSYACIFDRLCKVQKKGWVKKTRKGAL